MKKLKNTKGETLVESLASILIFTLASILFLSMVTTAARINKTVRDEDADFAARQMAVESVLGPEETVSVRVNGGDAFSVSVHVPETLPGEGTK